MRQKQHTKGIVLGAAVGVLIGKESESGSIAINVLVHLVGCDLGLCYKVDLLILDINCLMVDQNENVSKKNQSLSVCFLRHVTFVASQSYIVPA